ncbi:hypothetical protein C1924_04520 [Stenotrophomonas sp. ESTM1D_MKCIP4_1]|uniref:DUF3667 domain-containing protein n=1 Tax=Stenotrophomonas sp. ESTM1D_MKCIP4_1 TaxID=2072414 RepID=UPI000D53EC0B|nr:DUF3667 domain-containing protein [Stenotrophomonas sp. ESTM1D_MKCIP4_1]AWH52489.1 hypothetical protein C1924_04520 [Stenotrophomonas sp. ESTM1D_MKCIP4_1]
MSSTDSVHAALPDTETPAHGACENCAVTLHGHYCHHCGQSAHNPLKHVGHAIEEVFESFWHLDGRIFRTLRDLWIPGRIALNYLKGHRVSYVQPLRLFVILTLFTFFIGKMFVHVDDFSVGAGGNSLFGKATTAEQVEAVRAQQMALIDQQAGTANAGASGFAIARAAVNAAAAQRKAELGTPAAAAQPANDDQGTFFNYSINGKPWDADTNPIVLSGLPQFANHWLNRRLQNGNANIQRMGGKTDLYMQAILTALPGALFFLMPVFALVLRIAYIPRTMGYLEHLVVALYSHCWLMMVVLATFLVASVSHALASPAFATLSLWITALLWLSVPVYLLWMQQRVYGGNKVLTLLRYSLIGGVYFFLVNVVVMYAVLAGISA